MSFKLLNKDNKILTPVFTAAFVSVFQPKGIKGDPNSKKKYSVTMIFPKGTDFKPLQDLIVAVATEKWGAKAADILKKQAASDKRIFKDGSTMVEQGYAGFIEGVNYIQASTETKPGLVHKIDGSLVHLTDENDFYSGCTAIASINPYAWDNAYGKGVSLSLHNIQKVADGERLGGGRAKPEDDFEAADGEGSSTPGALF